MPNEDLDGATALYVVQQVPGARLELWVGSSKGLHRGVELGWFDRLLAGR
jgi:hypothetical protein